VVDVEGQCDAVRAPSGEAVLIDSGNVGAAPCATPSAFMAAVKDAG